MASIQLILNAVNNTSKAFDAVIASATTAANRVDDLNGKIDVTSAALDGQAAAAGRAADQLDKLALSAAAAAAVQDGLAAKTAASGDAARTTGGAFSVFSLIVGGSVGGIALWHLALDLAVEGLIAVTTAAAAAAIGVAAMAPAAQDIWQHLVNLNTVTGALGTSVPPLTGQFGALTDSMKPAVVEAYGGALDLVNRNTGVFAGVAHEVAGLLDTWIAKIDVWDASQNGMGKLLQSGVGFLAQFGSILGKIGVAIDNLISKDPGIAHFLLDFLNGAASLLDLVTRMPAPIIETGLALHGVYVYGNVAVGLLGKLVGAFGGAETAAGKAGTAMQAGFKLSLLASPWTWAVAGAAFLGYLAYEGTQADAATKNLINTMNSNLAGANFSGGLSQFAGDFKTLANQIATTGPATIAQVNHTLNSPATSWSAYGTKLSAVGDVITSTGKQIGTAWASTGNALTGQGSVVKAATDIWKVFNDAIAGSGAGQQQAANNIQALTAKQKNLVGEYSNSTAALTGLEMAGYTTSGAMNLLDQAGVKVTDSYAVQVQKVKNLIDGYLNLGIGAGQTAAAMNAANYATGQSGNALGVLDSKLSTVTQQEASLFAVLTGGESAFYAFQGGVLTLASDVTGKTVPAIGKLTSAQITAGSQFYSTMQQAEALTNAIQMQGTTGAALVPIVATTAAETLKYSGNVAGAKLSVVDFINNALGPGTVSLQNLKTWTDKNSVSQATFSSDVTQSQKSASGLAGVLNKNLIPMMNQAWTQATNLAPAMKTWFTDVVQGTQNTAKGQQDRQALINDLIAAGKAAGDSKGQIAGMISQVLKIPLKAAMALVMTGTGTFSVTQTGATYGGSYTSASGVRTAYPVKYAAAGWRIPGYGGGDRVPILAEAGETIVPKHLTPLIAGAMKAHGVPGFAAGGLVDAGNTSVLTGQYAVTSYDKFTKSLTDAVAGALKQELQSSAGSVSGNVASYANVVRTALGMLGQPLTDVAVVLRQISTESGGNQFAVNRTDSNWAAGTPSVGPLQVIGPTFARWAGPFRNVGPFEYGVSTNPLANVYAGLDYAIHTYPNWTSVLGQGHGYASGGIIAEPVAGIGLRSGSPYSFGENGMETVTPGVGRGVSINIAEMNVRHESDVAVVAQRLSGMIRTASLGGGFSG